MREYFIWLTKFVTVLFVFCFVVPFIFIALIGASTKVFSEQVTGDKNRVAVVELKGMISSSKEVLEQLYTQAKDPKISGIVLKINSPGGAVGASQDIYSAVRKIKAQKPVVVSMESVAASGGLYAALSASKVYAEPGTLTGSIGVIMEIPNVSKIAEQYKFDMVTVKSGKFKDVGNMFREMTDEEHEFLQQTVNAAYEGFVDAVVEGRGIDREKVKAFADGRVILGSQAKELGLVDAYGDVYDAARAVFDLKGEPLPAGEIPSLYYVSDKFAFLKEALGSFTQVTSIFARPSVEMKYVMY